MTTHTHYANELNAIQFVRLHDSHVSLYLVEQEKVTRKSTQSISTAGYQYYVHTLTDFREDK